MKSVVSFVTQELKAFTGLNDTELAAYIGRKKYPYFKDEWSFWTPDSSANIHWYYVTSRAYLFANAKHQLHNNILSVIKKGDVVLDFGGGSGNYSFQLASKGCKVQYFDVNILQREFVKFVSKRNNFGIEVLEYEKGMPIFTKKVNTIIALDVLEHIPNYDQYISSFKDNINVGGQLYIHAPFGVTPITGIATKGTKTTIGDASHLEDPKGMEKVLVDNKFKRASVVAINNGAKSLVYRRI